MLVDNMDERAQALRLCRRLLLIDLSMTLGLADTDVSCGGSTTLKLNFNKFPKPKMVWPKNNGEVITAGDRIRFFFEDEETIALRVFHP
jgi:hypothetical protein